MTLGCTAVGIKSLAGSSRIFRGFVAAVVAAGSFGCAGPASDSAETVAAAPESQDAAGDSQPDADEAVGSDPEPVEALEPEPESSPSSTTTTTAADGPDPSGADGGPSESTPREDVPSALRDPGNPDHPEPLVDLGSIQAVVRPDDIPALDDPAFEPAGDADWLPSVEPVLALVINGDARAYPLRIMTWHELVNGTVGGVPVTVSYCPLCNSAVAYDRRVGERILDFGTSGALFNSSLVMYDRQTESLWSHYTGEAVVGHLTGAQLDLIPVQTVSFETFLAAHPDGQVLSQDTGHFRQYGQNPYRFYDDPDGRPFLFGGPFDDRLDPMTRVVALRGDGEDAVIPHDVLAERRVVPFTFEGRDLVALYEPGTASALDTGVIAEGRDVGATGVFVRWRDGRQFDLSVNSGGGFVDAGTGEVFDILGRSAGSGVGLEPVEHLDTFWFAAAAFYPDAVIVEP